MRTLRSLPPVVRLGFGGLLLTLTLTLASCRKGADPEMPADPVRTPAPGSAAGGSGTPLYKLMPTLPPAGGEGSATPAAGTEAAPAKPTKGGAAPAATEAAAGKPAKPGATPETARASGSATPAPGAKGAPQAATDAAIRDRIEAWRAAWEKKDLETYLSFYGKEFRGDGLDLAGWRDRKKRVFASAGDLKVEVADLKIRREPKGAVVTFTQSYTSGTHTDRGKKELLLVEDAGSLRIVSEKFEK